MKKDLLFHFTVKKKTYFLPVFFSNFFVAKRHFLLALNDSIIYTTNQEKLSYFAGILQKDMANYLPYLLAKCRQMM